MKANKNHQEAQSRSSVLVTQCMYLLRIAESPFKQIPVLLWKCCLHSPNLIENDHNFVFFGYKVTIQQHFKSRLFWKTKTKYQEAENLRKIYILWLQWSNVNFITITSGISIYAWILSFLAVFQNKRDLKCCWVDTL